MNISDVMHKYTNKYDSNVKSLVVFDNNKHTFFSVVDEIWIATGHDIIQCEQLALLIKSKGYAVIKISDVHELIPMSETLELSGFKTLICKEDGTQNN
jgi:hypothetical protein